MNGNFAQYFFATADVFVAPVVENATVNTPSTQCVVDAACCLLCIYMPAIDRSLE